MNDKYFTAQYISAEDSVTEFRKKCKDCTDLETLNTAWYELETLKGYVQIAIGEIELLRDKFYKE